MFRILLKNFNKNLRNFYTRNKVNQNFNKNNSESNNNNQNQVFMIGSSIFIYGLGYYLLGPKENKYIKTNWQEIKRLKENDMKINKVEIKDNKTALIYPNGSKNVYYLNISEGKNFEEKMEKLDENIIVEYKYPSPLQQLLTTLLPTLLGTGLIFYILRRQQGNNFSSLFQKEFKIIEEKTGIKLKDVAGLHQTKKDVLEFSDIIMKPERYLKIGTKIPKGILMEGPPGTGKTMLAKAIADNYDSKFYLINGSDFIQPIIGTGSRKIKDLFETARKNTPAIIFIDEIDAVGKSRNNGKTIGNDERDNILNSLLVEMDGFNDNDKLLIMGATNRADILDSALLRPGRFDRIVKFDLPNLEERIDIMNIYFDKYNISKELSREKILKDLAYLTFGFNGAQLCNLFNEASIIAIRENCDIIEATHFEKAIDYILLGEKSENLLSIEEKNIIAYHEAGHALVSYLIEDIPSPSKVSITPRKKGMLGFSMSIPEKEKKLITKTDMLNQIMVLMGGRIAENLIFNESTNGAKDDINKMNKIANDIVTEYGMSHNLGLKTYNQDTRNNFFRTDSEYSIELVDKEIKNILFNCQEKTEILIQNNISSLHKIRNLLLERETIYKIDLDKIFN